LQYELQLLNFAVLSRYNALHDSILGKDKQVDELHASYVFLVAWKDDFLPLSSNITPPGSKPLLVKQWG
jgi:hypothetical protein